MKKHTLISKKNFLILICAFISILSVSALGWTPVNSELVANAKTDATQILETQKANPEVSTSEIFDNYILSIYTEANLASLNLDLNVFRKAVTGYYNLRNTNQVSSDKQIISIVDFTKSSREKRLWIIDLEKKEILFNTLVAHGRGSGDDMATAFSNITNSFQSSLGFYATSAIYYGKHGRSLKLNGLDNGYNNNALSRAIVVHGADYVSESFINKQGRLGRSHGCPALPVEFTAAIIDTIKGNTCLFINGPETSYTSDYLNQDVAASNFIKNSEVKMATL